MSKIPHAVIDKKYDPDLVEKVSNFLEMPIVDIYVTSRRIQVEIDSSFGSILTSENIKKIQKFFFRRENDYYTFVELEVLECGIFIDYEVVE